MKLKALLRVSAAIVLLLPAVANAQDDQAEEIVVTAERTNCGCASRHRHQRCRADW